VRLTHIVVRHHLLMVENLLVRWTICSRYRSVGLFRCRAVALWVLSSLSLSLYLFIISARACIFSLLSCARAARCNSDLSIITRGILSSHYWLDARQKSNKCISRVFFFWLCSSIHRLSLSLWPGEKKTHFSLHVITLYWHDVDKKNKKRQNWSKIRARAVVR